MNKTVTLALAICLICTGCNHSPEQAVIGSWEQKRESNNLLEGLANMAIAKEQITLNKDHTFQMNLPTFSIEISSNSSNVATSSAIVGNWSLNGTSVAFNTKTIDGKDIAQLQKEVADQAEKNRQAQAQAEINRKMSQAQSIYATDAPTGQPKPGFIKDQLVIPQSATISDDGTTLSITFQNNAQPPTEFKHPR